MTRVDFYVLQATEPEARMLFVCRLVDKAFGRGNRILINVQDKVTADQLDDLLWSFRPESFIPHCQMGAADGDKDVPVVIAVGQDQADHHDLLINLGAKLPEHFSRFRRLAEVVIQAEPVLQATREHYLFLRQRGYPVETHKL